ncbi:methionyl-tRNA formyltransferase [Fulvitalea axinellae]|uniref:Methionyl-tRNA formyltransferase n=1 Tax=Fulvitalea axinellae TaxID=1182444 RepID=A0AAU9DJ85_9BACT|nr:methionyl-tRNA formyltransferase [Fulvitalea axinellae]
MNKDLRIIYMGTPEFAVPSLASLVEGGYNVVAVVTAPDKPKGRGRKLGTTPVKDYAVEKGIPVLQPERLKAPEFIEELSSYKADLQVVVAFRMLPEVVWSMPQMGTFNLHASLLPQYRGAAPINWAIINGEKKTGLTTFLLKHEIDTGSVLLQVEEPINEDDNVGTLYARLMEKGGSLVTRTVDALADGSVNPVPQPENVEIKHAPKIFKETCKIDWNRPTAEVYDFIRGLSPYPAAWTDSIEDGKTHKVFLTEKESSGEQDSKKAGEFVTDGKKFLKIRTLDGYINIKELQAPGKRRMGVEDFLRGNKL